MNKLIIFALQSKFPADTLYALIEVLEATPSPEVGAMILMGLYESPELPLTRTTHPERASAQVIGLVEMTEFNKFTNRVSFKCSVANARTRWFATQEEADATESFDDATRYQNGGRISRPDKEDGFQFAREYPTVDVQNSWCDATTWMKQ